MKRLEFVKKVAQSLRDESNLEDILNEEICEIAFELLCKGDKGEFHYIEDSKCFLEEERLSKYFELEKAGLLKYLSDYQLDNLYDGYLDRQFNRQQDNWG